MSFSQSPVESIGDSSNTGLAIASCLNGYPYIFCSLTEPQYDNDNDKLLVVFQSAQSRFFDTDGAAFVRMAAVQSSAFCTLPFNLFLSYLFVQQSRF